MENKKKNALDPPTKADKSKTSTNCNSSKQDNYNKPAAINQELRAHLSEILEITDDIAEINISAQYADFMINSLIVESDQMKESAAILLNFKNIVTMARIALDYSYKAKKSASELLERCMDYTKSLRSVCNE
ncbi:MAG: hypothetical protein K2K42_02490 [Eubacterium sp.]|nr:hypothetical protein [Eubacterium sp.]